MNKNQLVTLSFKVGTVHHRDSRPPSGSDAERKLIEAFSKHQYEKYTRSATSLIDVNRLDQSRSVLDRNSNLETTLQQYDLM